MRRPFGNDAVILSAADVDPECASVFKSADIPIQCVLVPLHTAPAGQALGADGERCDHAADVRNPGAAAHSRCCWL